MPYLYRRALGANEANVVVPWRLLEGNVLPDENTDADAAQIETVEELVDLWHLGEQCLRVCGRECVG